MRVEIRGVGTAVPAFAATQENVLEFVSASFPVTDRTKALYRKTLRNPSILKRHFALPALSDVLEQNHDRVNARFQKSAVQLATEALRRALENAAVAPGELDFLAATTCTGYLCPGLCAYLIESCGLRTDVRIADLVGMGCGAAIPALEQASNFLIANPGKKAAAVCVEICSAAMYSNDDVDIVISNTIFSDGAAAVVLDSSDKGAAIKEFASLIIPEWRDTLRFESKNGHLKNVLGKNVPEQSAEATERLVAALVQKTGIAVRDIGHWIVHAGGEKIIDSVQKRFALNPESMAASRRVLKNYGNMSSPTVLFVLEEETKIHPPQPGEWGLLASFGAGFSAHGALVQWT